MSLAPQQKHTPRMVLVKAHGANRLALSSAVDIFESAIEVFQDMAVDRPQILGSTGVQQSIVEKTLDRVMLRASREGPRHSAEKLVTIILFHLDSDFVKPQVSFAGSGNAAFIQDKCYAAVIKWLSLRATLPAVLTEYEVEFERFLKFAFVRMVYGLRPEIRTKKNLWDAMAVLGLKEYLNSTPAVRASFQRRIAQIYATAVDALEQSKCDGKDLAATVTDKTLDLLQSQKPHDGVSWLMMMQTQKRTALHTFKVLLYHCEVVPPGMRVALDDSTLAVMCAEAATRWKQVRDSTEPPASIFVCRLVLCLGAFSCRFSPHRFAFIAGAKLTIAFGSRRRYHGLIRRQAGICQRPPFLFISKDK